VAKLVDILASGILTEVRAVESLVKHQATLKLNRAHEKFYCKAIKDHDETWIVALYQR
jgi:hypothetical protein